MIHVTFTEPKLSRWIDWKARCAAKLQLLLAIPPGQRVVIDTALYKECRDLIFAGYGNKCAYCEGPIGAQTRGDVEHFRPKGGVRDLSNKIVYAAKGKAHAGYWWLAYDPENLLPACDMCNRYSKSVGGKGERFPVEGFRAQKPGQEKKEKAVLIHPGFVDPADHLDLDVGSGLLRAKTKRGHTCIRILGLNREGLVEERKRAIEDATLYMTAPRSRVTSARIAQQIQGVLPYALVWRAVRSVTK